MLEDRLNDRPNLSEVAARVKQVLDDAYWEAEHGDWADAVSTSFPATPQMAEAAFREARLIRLRGVLPWKRQLPPLSEFQARHRAVRNAIWAAGWTTGDFERHLRRRVSAKWIEQSNLLLYLGSEANYDERERRLGLVWTQVATSGVDSAG